MEKRRLSLTNQDTHTKSFRLNGKVAVVTGGGSGIGRAIALRFAGNGATVRILDLNEQDATAACQQITAEGGNASALLCDVTNQKEVTSRFDELAGSGPIHILVNNAGVSHIGSLENTTERHHQYWHSRWGRAGNEAPKIFATRRCRGTGNRWPGNIPAGSDCLETAQLEEHICL